MVLFQGMAWPGTTHRGGWGKGGQGWQKASSNGYNFILYVNTHTFDAPCLNHLSFDNRRNIMVTSLIS